MSINSRYAIALLLVSTALITLRAQTRDSLGREMRVRVDFVSTEHSHFGRRRVQSMIGTTLPTGGDALLVRRVDTGRALAATDERSATPQRARVLRRRLAVSLPEGSREMRLVRKPRIESDHGQ